MSGASGQSLLTVEDLLKLKSIGEAQVDPSGSRVAFVVAESVVEFKQPSPVSRIWLTDVAGGEPRQLTQGPGSDDLPRWSPDGSMLAFRSDRAKRGSSRLYLLRAAWQEAMPLGTLDRPVSAIHWSPDGRRVAVIAKDKRANEEERREGDDPILYDEDTPYARLWLIDIATGDTRCLTPGPLHVWEVDWAPDGRSLAAIVTDLPIFDAWYHARLVSLDAESGEARVVYSPASENRQIKHPAWSPDGRSIAILSATWSDPPGTSGDIFVAAAGGESPSRVRDLTAGQPRSFSTFRWLPDSSGLIAAATERNRAAICEVGLDGETETLWSDERAFGRGRVSFSADGGVVATGMSSPTQPSELWIGRVARDGEASIDWQQRSSVNADFPDTPLPRVETLAWKAPDGMPVEGILLLPPGEPTGPLPMVVMVHGGPSGSSGYSFTGVGLGGVMDLLAQRGVAIFMPNYRGSTGWGLEFAEANIGDLGGGDLADVLAGVDECVSRGIADPARLGICGWSYGGYLTPWAITQTDRFKAAISGASITSWYSYHGGSDRPGFDEFFYRTDPYSLDGPYAARSPLFQVDKVVTPTLFLHGGQDECCPVIDPQQMSRGLRAKGVETQCVIYPREGHGIREREHVRDLMERSLAWFMERLG